MILLSIDSKLNMLESLNEKGCRTGCGNRPILFLHVNVSKGGLKLGKIL
jgi:hypothetical protein